MVKYTAGNSWAVDYRPTSLDQIVGLKPQVAFLRGMLKSSELPNTLGLFGPTGSGKTTIAQIIAQTVNGTLASDWHDINISDERGINEMRDITKMARFKPQHHVRFIFLDEIHQATPQSISALLKPAESGPKSTCYIIASSKPELILPDLMGRATKVFLDLPKTEEIVALLKTVAKKHNSPLARNSKALALIAEAAGNQPRDSISMLYTVHCTIKGGKLREPADVLKHVRTMVATSANEIALKALVALHTNDVAGLLAALGQTKEQAAILACLLDLNLFLLYRLSKSWTWMTAIRAKALEAMRKNVKQASLTRTIRIQNALLDLQSECRSTSVADYLLVIGRLSRICATKVE